MFLVQTEKSAPILAPEDIFGSCADFSNFFAPMPYVDKSSYEQILAVLLATDESRYDDFG